MVDSSSRAMVVVLLLVAAGCGGSEPPRERQRASPVTLELGWREVERLGAGSMTLEVDALTVRRQGWAVELAVTNGTDSVLLIGRGHRPGASYFGLSLLRTTSAKELEELTADGRKAPPVDEASSFAPALPDHLAPGQRWHGTMRGRRPLAAGDVVRVVVGRFSARPLLDRAPSRFLLISDHFVVLE